MRSEANNTFNGDFELQAARLKEANQSLIDSEQRLRLAIAAGGVGLWIWNSTDVTNAGDWSPRLKEIMGLPLDAEVTHDLFLKCVHPEDRERVDQCVMQALGGANGGVYSAEYRTISPADGSKHWVTASGQAFFNIQGQAIRFIGTVMDITARKQAEESLNRLNSELEERISQRLAELAQTNRALQNEIAERKRAEDELRRSKAYLEHALELSHTGSVGFRASERQLFWSSETARMYGYDPAIPPTREMVLARVHPDDRPLLEEAFVRIARGRASFDFEHRLLMPDGSIKYLHTRAHTVTDELGNEECLGALMDITERKQAEEALRLTEQSRQAAVMEERNRMARDIHDTLAQGFTGVIVQLEAAEDASSHGLTEEARAHLSRAGDMARYGLKEARRSVQALRLQALEDHDLCTAMHDLFRKMTNGTILEPEFSVHGMPGLLPPQWEENLLRIAQEVLTNALRHAHAKHFKARLHFEARQLSLKLSDDGCGFDPVLHHDGFGLMGMKERVEQMGGQISMQSEKGKGTIVSLVLPFPDDDQSSNS